MEGDSVLATWLMSGHTTSKYMTSVLAAAAAAAVAPAVLVLVPEPAVPAVPGFTAISSSE
jgi:hypothetical protein